jgi:hypothetical protein
MKKDRAPRSGLDAARRSLARASRCLASSASGSPGLVKPACTLTARRVKETRKFSAAQTAVFCSYDHLRSDLYFSQARRLSTSRASYDNDLEGRSPQFRRVRLEGAIRRWKRLLAVLVHLSFHCSNHATFANGFVLIPTNSGITTNSPPDNRIPDHQSETMADAMADKPVDAVNVREKLEGESRLYNNKMGESSANGQHCSADQVRRHGEVHFERALAQRSS